MRSRQCATHEGVRKEGSNDSYGKSAQFVKDGHYAVKPKKVGRNTTGQDRFQRFTQQFELPVEVEKIPPEKYVRRLNVAPPPRETAGGQGFDFGFPEMGGQP